jgi:hypothetical protein
MTPEEAREVRLPLRPLKRAQELGRLASDLDTLKSIGWKPTQFSVITRRELIGLAEINQSVEEDRRVRAEVIQSLQTMADDTHQRLERLEEILETIEGDKLDGENI